MASASDHSIIYLQHLAGSRKGQIDSFESDQVRIGRQADNDLRFDPKIERTVSGYHAEIYRQGDALWIKDLQSKNGTFVNGRQIAEPVPIAPGDTIQLSLQGPKITLLAKPPADRSSVLATSFGDGTSATPRVASAGSNRWSLIGLAVAAILVLAGLAYTAWTSRWPLFAILLGGAALIGGLLVWRRSGWRNPFRARSATPRAVTAAAPGAEADAEGVKDLRRKWAEALTMLRKTHQDRRSEDPVSAVPWVLVLGETGSGKTETIRSANPLSWLSSMRQDQRASVTQNCDWWFFDTAVLLDTAGRYAMRAAEQANGSEWREILSLLRRSRPDEPIDGVVVTVATDALVARSLEQLQEEAGHLRRRLDEIGQALGAAFPVYLVATKMDCLSGFSEFFGGLQETHQGQAMGAANADLDNPAGAAAFCDRAFRSVTERLDQLRLARMDEEERPETLRRIYLFPEEFRHLRAPLRAFIGALFRHSPYQETPLLRGLFFTSAIQGGPSCSPLARAAGVTRSAGTRTTAPRAMFSRDVFCTILPQDRPLARQTPMRLQKSRRTQRRALIGVGALSVACIGLLTLSFFRNSQALSHLALDACLERPASAAQGGLGARLKEADACREVVESLTPRTFWGRLASNFGLEQRGRLQAPLRQRYLDAFRTRILEPLDARVDQKLSPGPEAPLYVSALIQQIGVLARCRGANGCPPLDDSMTPAYRVLLSAEAPDVRGGDPRVALLARTHEAYLRWVPDPRLFEQMHARQVQRVMRWLQSGGLRAEWILASASAQFPEIRSRDFWELDAPGRVESPYTQRAWKEGIQPLLTGLKLEAPGAREVRDLLAQFEESYRSEFFRQWDRFLAGFPQGERIAGGQSKGKELAVRVLGPDSPYRRVIDTASANLTPLIGTAPLERDVPSWAVTLQRYTALKGRSVDPSKGAQGKPEESKGKAADEDRQTAVQLKGYLETLEQLRGEFSTTEKAYKAALKALEEGEPSDKASFLVQKAAWSRDQVRRAIGSRQGEDRTFWVLASRPLELAWRSILDQAGLHLQGQWEALRLEIADLPAGPRAGKVLAFVNGQAAPFLERRRDAYVPKPLLNDNILFTRAFLDYVSRALSVSPEDLGKLEFPRQIVSSI